MKYLDEVRTQGARSKVYGNIGTWMCEGKIKRYDGVDVLCEILDKKNLKCMLTTMTAEDEAIIHALAGPHAWTIYKVIMAKKSK